MSEWGLGGRRTLYDSEWVRLELVDVRLPDGRQLSHHVVRLPKASVKLAVVVDGRVLMLWRHRFITGRWGWELPGGWVDPGEDAAAAARREVEEETGWRPGPAALLLTYSADHGISDSRFLLYRSLSATRTGQPPDRSESDRVEWVSLDQARPLLSQGHISDGPTVTALLHLLAFGGSPAADTQPVAGGADH